MRIIKQSVTTRKLVFLLVQSSDHITGLTGATVGGGLTVTISKNGAGFAAPTGTIAEVGNGFYALTPSSADTSVLGSLVLHATAPGADPSDVEFEVVAFDPQDSVRMGQTALPNVTAGGLNGLPLSVDTAGRVDVLKINGTSQTARDIGASVLLSSGTGTGQVNLALGRIGINWGDVTNQSTAVALTNTTISSVTGSVGSVTGSVGSVTGTVTANTTQLAGQTVTAATGVTFPTTVSSLTAANVWQTDVSGFVTAGQAGTFQKNTDVLTSSRMATFTLPTNFSSLAITAGGAVTVGTNNDKTGYSLTQAFPSNFSALAITAGGVVSANTTQLAGQTVTAAAGVTFPSVVSNLTAQNVWDYNISGYVSAGLAGTYLKGAGAAGDPWSAALPGAYAAGTAGFIVGNRLDVAVSSRMATFTLPTNFSSLAITAGGATTVGTNNDKTGYSLSSPQTFSLTGNITGNLSGSVGSVTGSVGSVIGDVGGKVIGNGVGSIVGDGVRAVSVTGNVGGNVVGSVGSVVDAVTVGTVNADAINAASIATDAIDADAIAASAVAEIQSGLSTLNATAVENAVWNAPFASHTTAGTYGGRIPRSDSSNVEVKLTGSAHIAADIHELQPAVIENIHFNTGAIDANALATDAVAEIVDGVWDELRGASRPAGSFGAYLDGSIAGVQTTVNTINSNTDGVEAVTNKLNTMMVQVGAGPNYQYTTQALAFAPGGTGDINNYVPVTLPFGTNVRHTLTFNAGATLPLREDILQQQDRTPLDLSDATAVVYELMPVDGASPTVYATATVVDDVAGRVRYTWQGGDLDTVGTYRERWIITYPSGQVSVFGPLIKVA